jgi:hypothetical protein
VWRYSNLSATAVSNATRLSEINFPEFTAKLVTDTFDALVAANVRQTEAYMALLKAVSQDLKDFINDTKDDIDGEMILQYLTTIVSNPATTIKENGKVTKAEAEALNKAVAVEGMPETTSPITVAAGETTTITKAMYEKIINACATRIAADKYTMLKEMTKMGMLRLVVENGLIETRLTFTTYGYNYNTANASSYNSSAFSAKASASTGKFVSLWCKASASTSLSTLRVSTASSSSSSYSSTSIEIYGSVKINFKTDYQQLSSTT